MCVPSMYATGIVLWDTMSSMYGPKDKQKNLFFTPWNGLEEVAVFVGLLLEVAATLDCCC